MTVFEMLAAMESTLEEHDIKVADRQTNREAIAERYDAESVWDRYE